jgi:hypothetical protein
MQGIKFEDELSEVEKAAWKSFKNVIPNILVNHKAEDCRAMAAVCYSPTKRWGVICL